ncbi:MAG TPA: hypothetical protein VM166_03845 [Gemmatimonadaceae bacterium]|nr:hypothetical protein [Gemmatimonadaceae bacterium]
MRATPWIIAYIAALVIWLIVLFIRRAPTLLRGRALLWLNAMFLVVIAVNQVSVGARGESGLIAFEAFLLLSGALANEVWLLLHISRPEIARVLEMCFKKTLARYQGRDDGYIVSPGADEMKVSLASIGPVTRIRFSGARTSRKAGLVKSVFTKQFKTSFPKPRFRT